MRSLRRFIKCLNIMKKLIITCCSLGRGGAERVLSILSTPFADEYNHVEILMWRDGPISYKFDDRVKIISIKQKSQSNNILKQMLWLRQYVKNNRPDLILSFLAQFNMLTLTSLLFVNVKIVVAERIDPSKFKKGPFIRFVRDLLYLKAVGILTQTQSGKNYFNPILRKKTVVIYNPILLENNKIGGWDINNTDKVIITAARLVRQKNQKMLIDAFSLFHKIHPEYKLIIYGEGDERKKLENLIEAKKLNNIVLLPGNSTQIWHEMLKSRLFVLSSNYEGMSNSLIEAMCIGLPCISTKVSGSIDLINHEDNGLLVDINNTKAFYEAMLKLIDDDKKSISISNNASKLFEKLNVTTISTQWIDYLNSRIY